jgi:hypothetical protein
MKFLDVYQQKRRMIVIHHILDDEFVLCRLNQNDLVFFDDCLYSQYIFIKKYHQKLYDMNIVCVMGLSPKAIRPDNIPGISNIESHILHNQMNSHIKTYRDEIHGEFISGFMSKNEIDDVLNLKNIFLALHGCCHLKLENISNQLERIKVFIDDTNDGKKMLETFGYKTDIFVYPYDYEPSIGDAFLRRIGFRYIFGGDNSKRIYVETMK